MSPDNNLNFHFEKMPGTVTVGVLDLVPIFGLMTPIDTIPIVSKHYKDPRQV